jgi:hypothetical protein
MNDELPGVGLHLLQLAPTLLKLILQDFRKYDVKHKKIGTI